MNYNKFGKLILFLGIIIFAWGGFQYLGNQPLDNNSLKLRERVETNSANAQRNLKRDSASNKMIAGGVVAFIGIAISFSAGDNKDEE